MSEVFTQGCWSWLLCVVDLLMLLRHPFWHCLHKTVPVLTHSLFSEKVIITNTNKTRDRLTSAAVLSAAQAMRSGMINLYMRESYGPKRAWEVWELRNHVPPSHLTFLTCKFLTSPQKVASAALTETRYTTKTNTTARDWQACFSLVSPNLDTLASQAFVSSSFMLGSSTQYPLTWRSFRPAPVPEC